MWEIRDGVDVVRLNEIEAIPLLQRIFDER